jgi:hypothetical protein
MHYFKQYSGISEAQVRQTKDSEVFLEHRHYNMVLILGFHKSRLLESLSAYQAGLSFMQLVT